MDKTPPQLERLAREIRATCVQMAHDGKESHLSSALSCVDILTALFGGWMRTSAPDGANYRERDRFILSKGHGCAALYAAMAAFGALPARRLKEYAQTDSPLPNHPCKFAMPSLEVSSGSLGHGLGIAAGMLYGAKLDNNGGRRAVVLMSDGECNEGSVWEAAMFAAAHKMRNLLAIVDYNGLQAVAKSDEIMAFTSLEKKFASFGWEAVTIDGNSIHAILAALNDFPFSETRPSAIIAKTRVASGVPFMEGAQEWFYRTPNAEEVERAFRELGARPLREISRPEP